MGAIRFSQKNIGGVFIRKGSPRSPVFYFYFLNTLIYLFYLACMGGDLGGDPVF